MLAARLRGGGAAPDRRTRAHRTCGSGVPGDVPLYGPVMGIETVVLLFVWLVIAEVVLTKLVNGPE